MFLLGILGLIVFYQNLGWVPANGRLAEIASPMYQIQTAMMLGKTSVKDGAAEMQKTMQRILDQPVPGL